MNRIATAACAFTGAALLTALSMGASPNAQAQTGAVTVFGNTDAQICFQEARFGTSTSVGLGACDEALRFSSLSIRDRVATLVNRGILFNRARRFDDAITDFNEAMRLDPAKGEAYLNRGNSYFFKKNFPAALADYDRAIELDTHDLHAAYFNRGLVLEAMNRFEEALEAYERSLEIRPEFVPAAARASAVEARLSQMDQEGADMPDENMPDDDMQDDDMQDDGETME